MNDRARPRLGAGLLSLCPGRGAVGRRRRRARAAPGHARHARRPDGRRHVEPGRSAAAQGCSSSPSPASSTSTPSRPTCHGDGRWLDHHRTASWTSGVEPCYVLDIDRGRPRRGRLRDHPAEGHGPGRRGVHRDRRAAPDRLRDPGRDARDLHDRATAAGGAPDIEVVVTADAVRPPRRAPPGGAVPATCATIRAVNPLDLIAVLLVVLGVVLGFRSGALPQVGGLLGAIGGGALAILALPALADPARSSRGSDHPPVRRPRRPARRGRHRRVDRLGRRAGRGAAGSGPASSAPPTGSPVGFVGAAQALLIVWLAGGLLAVGPVPRLAEAAQTSTAVRDLNAGPAAADRDRRRARRAARRVRPARGVHRLRAAAAPAGRLPTDAEARAIAAARGGEHVPGRRPAHAARVVGQRRRRRATSTS